MRFRQIRHKASTASPRGSPPGPLRNAASVPIPAGKNGFPGFKNKTSSPRRNPAGAVSVSRKPTRCKRGTRPARLRLTVQFPLLFSPSTLPLSLNLLYPQETITGWKKKNRAFPGMDTQTST